MNRKRCSTSRGLFATGRIVGWIGCATERYGIVRPLRIPYAGLRPWGLETKVRYACTSLFENEDPYACGGSSCRLRGEAAAEGIWPERS